MFESVSPPLRSKGCSVLWIRKTHLPFTPLNIKNIDFMISSTQNSTKKRLKSATQMISDLLNRAVSQRINLNTVLVRRRKGVTEDEVFYGVCGLVER